MTSIEQRSVTKSGNSLAVSLPAEWCFQNNIMKGAKVSLDVETDVLCIRPVNNQESQESDESIDYMQSEVTQEPERPHQKNGIDINALIRKHLEAKR